MFKNKIINNNKKNSDISVKSKDCFEILKSNFLLKRILNNMKKYKSLEIAKYNKRLQKRLNFNINDYKEYS